MYKPVLSIDISKSKSYAATFLNYGVPYQKPFVFNHSPEGIKQLSKKLKELEVKSGVKPEVVLEATGNYSKPISSYFQSTGFKVIILNPLQPHMLKRKSVRKIKTDPIDANRIAQVYYLDNPEANISTPELISDLLSLCRQYEGINRMFTEAQNRLHSVLDLIFPNYETVFRETFCKSSLMMLSMYPLPKDILSADRNDLVNLIKSCAKGRSLNWAEAKVNKLLAAARESLPSNVAQQSNTQVLKDYIRILTTYKEILTGIRAQIIAQAKLSPVYQLLQSIPGVGELTAAIILSEIGDITKFSSAKKLVAFSGLDPSVFESGKFKATNNKISKRGSSYLRKALYQATYAGICKRKNGPFNPVLHEYYSRKINEGKPSRVAIVASCNKLLRIIYGIWNSGVPFINVQ